MRMHHPSIANLLCRLGFTYKIEEDQNMIQWTVFPTHTLEATERRRARVRRQREDWFAHRLPVRARTPERVVFIPSRDIAEQCTASQ